MALSMLLAACSASRTPRDEGPPDLGPAAQVSGPEGELTDVRATSTTGRMSSNAIGDGSDGNTSTTEGGTPIAYSTEFDTTESPLSEGGAWRHLGQAWTFVEVSQGVAHGTQDGSGATLADAVNDSYAYLAGFPPNQRASGVIHKGAGIESPGLQEVELLLRWDDTAERARGYECLLAWDGSYVEIVRWNGGFNEYTYLYRGSPGRVDDGDVFAAEIVEGSISVTLNGRVIASANDSTHTTGNPGVGFFRWNHGGTTNSQSYGFKSFHASAVTP